MAKNKKENAIILSDVSKTYFGPVDTPVLFDINLEIEQGSFNAIIGQSGSGKTTLLNILGTLDQPTSGQVMIDGMLTSKMDKKSLSELRNQKIGFVFQYHYLLEDFSIHENIMMPEELANGKSEAHCHDRADELLELVGIPEVRNKRPNQVSGGQRQRAAIARALMNNPSIIFADEPTGNLDSKSTEVVYDLFRKINKEFGTTFVIITHDENIAKRADRIITIEDGRVS